MQLHGSWQDAVTESQQACEQFSQPTPAGGWRGVLPVGRSLSLRGQFAEAEDAYRQASQLQRTPQPGLAQLRFAQGHLDAANVAIRRVLEGLLEPPTRASALDAYVELCSQ